MSALADLDLFPPSAGQSGSPLEGPEHEQRRAPAWHLNDTNGRLWRIVVGYAS